MNKKHILSVTAITEITGEGQKCVAAAVEFDQVILTDSVMTDCFIVENRKITAAYTNDAAERRSGNHHGRFVILELEHTGNLGSTREQLGHGPHGRSRFHKAEVKVTQIKNLRSANGEELLPWTEAILNDKTKDSLADRFQELSYAVPGTDRILNYQLFVPENSRKEPLPLVIFVHDAGSCSDEPVAPLAQGNGAVIWASETEQKKRPCYILAPCYPKVCANDEFQLTPESEDTIALINHICHSYPIDRNRIYGTGQSMGCMMLCEWNIRHPNLFAGCLLVAGQWNPETMSVCKNKNLWIIVSEGDQKAFPIMGECMKRIEQAGGGVSRKAFDAKSTDEELSLAVRQLWKEGKSLYFTWFSGNSILPEGIKEAHPGLHHVLTWTRAYDITALREWLFYQSIGKERNP